MPDGDVLVVYDDRALGVARQRTFDGVRRSLLEYCDSAQTVEMLEKRLKSERGETAAGKADIQAILDEFVRHGLMIKDGSRYLSLPIMAHLG